MITKSFYRAGAPLLGLGCILIAACGHETNVILPATESDNLQRYSGVSRVPRKGLPPSVDDLPINGKESSKNHENVTESENTLSGPRASFGDRFGVPYSASTSWGNGEDSPEHPPPDSARGEPEIPVNSVAEGYIESIKHQEYTNAPGTTRTIEDDVGEGAIADETVYRKNLNPWISPPSTMTSE